MKDLIQLIKRIDQCFIALLITCMLALCLCMLFYTLWVTSVTNGQPHTCKWNMCPYKGVCRAGADSAVTHYVGDSLRYTDGWCVDMLHIEHPEMEYDQLDSLLFTQKK